MSIVYPTEGFVAVRISVFHEVKSHTHRTAIPAKEIPGRFCKRLYAISQRLMQEDESLDSVME